MLNASLESAQRLFEVNSKESTQQSYCLQPENWKPSRIEMEGISFVYHGEEKFRLNDISFVLEQGKKVGIMGPSGAGKTSVVNLLLSFWQPISGRILLDQMELGHLNPYQVRSYYSVISQNTWLFSSSLRDNLLLADPRADDLKMMKTLEEVDLGNWANHLPQKLDTWLGDQGMRLSGGERQRVAIARALLQERPYIILDEPVENLDTISKKHILEKIFQLFKQRGLLLITHDLTVLEKMDEILVLENGSISEHGDYSSLMRKKGKFADLVKLSKQSFLI
jgi:ATP-binding cassette, subfamily C, bacterial CydC